MSERVQKLIERMGTLKPEDFGFMRYGDFHRGFSSKWGAEIDGEPLLHRGYPNQYYGVIFWWKWKFKKPIEYGNILVDGVHIVPYRFRDAELLDAKPNNFRKFNFEILTQKNFSYIDHDKNSNNYHKIPTGEPQVVLFEKGKGGPGNTSNKQMYFPALDDYENDYKVEELIEMALNALGIK